MNPCITTETSQGSVTNKVTTGNLGIVIQWSIITWERNVFFGLGF